MHQPLSHITLSLAVLAMAMVAACSRNQQGTEQAEDDSVVPVAAAPAPTGRLRAALHVSGIVVPSQGAEFLVIASEPARIVEITRIEGQAVNAGDLLVRFEAPAAVQEMGRQRAEVARAQVQMENARVAHARTQDLVGRGLVPRNEIEGVERELAEAGAQLARAEAARAAAEAAVARASVRAPFAGVVAKRLHNVGDIAQASPTDPVLRVIDPRRLEVLASIPSADIARVLPGASARLATLVDGKQVPLAVASHINPAERTADGSVSVRLAFLEPANLQVDTPVQVDIDAEERNNVVFVAPESLVKTGDETAVFIVAGDYAERRVVTTGVEDERGIEVTSGLKPGELVIIQGQAGLADGARVNADIRR